MNFKHNNTSDDVSCYAPYIACRCRSCSSSRRRRPSWSWSWSCNKRQQFMFYAASLIVRPSWSWSWSCNKRQQYIFAAASLIVQVWCSEQVHTSLLYKLCLMQRVLSYKFDATSKFIQVWAVLSDKFDAASLIPFRKEVWCVHDCKFLQFCRCFMRSSFPWRLHIGND
jgi:hypothetical protein